MRMSYLKTVPNQDLGGSSMCLSIWAQVKSVGNVVLQQDDDDDVEV